MARPKPPIDPRLTALVQREKEVYEQLHKLHQLTPHEPMPWDFSDNKQFLREGYRVIYLSDAHCETFIPFENEQFPTIKLINPRSPAHKITYYDKHKYWVIKDEEWSLEKKLNEISIYIDYIDQKRDKLMVRLHTRQTEPGLQQLHLQLDELNLERERWLTISEQLDHYELVQSTYFSNYRYWYINWKYQVSKNPPQFANDVAHLLSPIRDPSGQIIGHKLNIVFVNIEAILLKHEYQNKEIDLYLDQFHIRTTGVKRQLFARPKGNDDPAKSQ